MSGQYKTLITYYILLIKSHLQSYPCPLNINYFWNQGFLLGISIILQIYDVNLITVDSLSIMSIIRDLEDETQCCRRSLWERFMVQCSSLKTVSRGVHSANLQIIVDTNFPKAGNRAPGNYNPITFRLSHDSNNREPVNNYWSAERNLEMDYKFLSWADLASVSSVP